jgi:hypothetical protein
LVLSKSDYMLFLRQPAWLWLKKNDPKKLPSVDENTQALFDAGHQFEPYAESLFPEGVSLGFSDNDEYSNRGVGRADVYTARLLHWCVRGGDRTLCHRPQPDIGAVFDHRTD